MAHGIGFIGLGIMGQRMLAGMGLNGRVRPVAAWDPNPEAAKQALAAHPGIKLAAEAEELLADPGVACVYIASPPASHLAHAGRAFDRGKAVFSEKPLAVDLGESAAMVARVQREGHKAAINFPFASSPAVETLASHLASGEIGQLERIEIETVFSEWPRQWQAGARWLERRAEGGFVREVVSHFLFLTRRLAGPLSLKTAKVAYPRESGAAETAIDAELAAGGIPVRLSGGVRGTLADSNGWTACGASGKVRLHDWIKVSRLRGDGWAAVDLGPGELRQRSVKAQLDGLADMIEGRPHRLASFREGFEVQQCVEALLGNAASAGSRS